MAAALLLLVLATALIFLTASLSFRRHGKKEDPKLPPGDMGWPLIGETLSFLRPHSSTTVGRFLEGRLSRFGKIFVTNILGKLTVVSADAELNRFVFKNDMRSFEPGWPASFYKVMGDFSISSMVGDAHKHMRSIILDFLNSERLRTLFLQDAERMASLLLGSWDEESAISVVDEATKFSFYIMVKNILSIGPEDPEIEKLRREYDAFVGGLVSIPINLPGTEYWKALRSRANILKRLKKKVEERMPKGNDCYAGIQKDDFLGWVMSNTNYSQEQIGDFLLHTLFAAHDTTSRSISLMIYFLEGSPKATEQLREEHLRLVDSKKQGESKVSWDDYRSMEFTQCVINETLRLGNIVSNVHRKASTDIQFKGYVIPKGSIVMTHFSAVHLDPTLFEDPEHFNPWRWLCSSGVKKTNDFMPFGGGPRLCPGAELARMEMTVFLHQFLLKFDWELVEPDHPMHIPFVNFSKGLPIKVRALSQK